MPEAGMPGGAGLPDAASPGPASTAQAGATSSSTMSPGSIPAGSGSSPDSASPTPATPAAALPAAEAGHRPDTATPVAPAHDANTASVKGALRQERRLVSGLWRDHGWRLALVFATLLLPLWGFAEIAGEIHEGEAIAFDEPLLQLAHSLASAGLDRFFSAVTSLGSLYGVVPLDIALVAWLFARCRLREATFAALALAGSGLLNVATKLVFARERPALWESISPETTWSFPSGHAMGSATLACVLILLAWRTRWRWPALVVMVPLVVLVGLSRIYLGVHYTSDILAGWAAASAWVMASFVAVFGLRRHPWR